MKCPRCGHLNRPEARFCSQCREQLPQRSPTPAVASGVAPQQAIPSIAVTTKVCPHCASANRINARTCAKCGYQFVSRYTGSRQQPHVWFWSVGVVAVFIVIALLFSIGRLFQGDNPSPTPISAQVQDPLERALSATVQILTPDEGNRDRTSTGSGTVISSKGYILTNFHVVGDLDLRQLYNASGLILIGVSPSGSMQPPTIRYQAKVVEADYNADLVLLQIVALADGGQLPDDLGLTAVAVGDSNTVSIGDQLRIIGYPGLGGSTVTLTRGIVSGFLPEGWIKTDAEINPGNSGGAAINEAGDLVGIPTAGNVGDSFPGKLGLIRPVNMARHLIERAEREIR